MTATHYDPFRAGPTLTLTEFAAAIEANLARVLATPAPAVSWDGSAECDDETRLRLSRSARTAERFGGGGGLRVDEYGYTADGDYHVELDGGGQE